MQNLIYQKKKKMYNFTIFFKDSCFIPKISNRKLKYLYDCVTKARIYKDSDYILPKYYNSI